MGSTSCPWTTILVLYVARAQRRKTHTKKKQIGIFPVIPPPPPPPKKKKKKQQKKKKNRFFFRFGFFANKGAVLYFGWFLHCILPLLKVWLAYCFGFSVSSRPPPPPPPPPKKIKNYKNKQIIWILCQSSSTRELKIRVLWFVLKKLFTHFEILIVSHAPHGEMGAILYFTSFDSLVYCFCLSV